nr:MAG TPA: hypothetical protein [Caudoviricetes sp.]
MKNVIYNICEKLKGYSSDTEYFEVVSVEPCEDNNYVVVVKVVDTAEGGEQ